MIITSETEAHELLRQLAFHYVHQCHSLLEVGSGNGDFLREIAGKYQCPAWGVDPFAVNKSEAEIHFRSLPAEKIDLLKRRFDLVYSVHSLHHFNSPQNFFEKLEKVLSWNGAFILVDWKYGTHTGINERYYRLEEVTNWLINYDFQIIDHGATNENLYAVAALKNKKIAVATADGKTVFPKMMGQAPYFDIYQKTKNFQFLERRENIYQKTLQHLKTFDVYQQIDDCQAILTARIGKKGAERLQEMGVKLFYATGEIPLLLQNLEDSSHPTIS